jgi:hypothetical protein
LRPARTNSRRPLKPHIPSVVRPKAPFVAHIIAEMEGRTGDTAQAAKGYAAADALNYEDLSVTVASL